VIKKEEKEQKRVRKEAEKETNPIWGISQTPRWVDFGGVEGSCPTLAL